MSGHVEYQILVVTRLAAFKSAKHKPEDVVQFLVSVRLSRGLPRALWPGVAVRTCARLPQRRRGRRPGGMEEAEGGVGQAQSR